MTVGQVRRAGEAVGRPVLSGIRRPARTSASCVRCPKAASPGSAQSLSQRERQLLTNSDRKLPAQNPPWRTFEGSVDLSGLLPHQVPVSAPRHGVRLAYQAPDTRTQRIRAIAPVARYPLIPEQRSADLALARAVPDSIMHP